MKGTPARQKLLKAQLKFLVENKYEFKDPDKAFLEEVKVDVIEILK